MAIKQTREDKLLDKAIELEYYRQANGVQVSIMDIGKIFSDARHLIKTGVSVQDAIALVVPKYAKN